MERYFTGNSGGLIVMTDDYIDVKKAPKKFTEIPQEFRKKINAFVNAHNNPDHLVSLGLKSITYKAAEKKAIEQYEIDNDWEKAVEETKKYYIGKGIPKKIIHNTTNSNNIPYTFTISKEKLIKFLKSPDLMIKIKDQISIDHIGNNKEKVLLWINMQSSQLKPHNRNSPALKADSSEGKTNMVRACLINTPKTWFDFGTRYTQATLEDDIQKDLIIVLEKPKDDSVIEALKQLSEDGMKIWKKDITKDNKEMKTSIYVPRKVVVWTDTEGETEEQLENRYLVISIPSDKQRYNKVADKIKQDACDLNKLSDDIIDDIFKHETILSQSLLLLEKFDDVVIPYAKLMPIDFKSAREQRDFKRFLNVVKVITWIHQYQRQYIEYKGKRFLIATPEDFWWACYISDRVFRENISGIDIRLQETLNKIEEMSKKSEFVKPVLPDDCEMFKINFIDRSDLQREMNIKRQETIKNRYCFPSRYATSKKLSC